MKQVIKEMVKDALLFELIDNFMSEDYPSNFDMAHFKSLTKFKERIRYCEEHLKRISSGSSRIVYMIDNTKVLKLAMNTKGIAQCKTEIQWGGDYYFEDILAHTLDSHPKGLWVEMELARKVKESDFKKMLGFDFMEFGKYLKIRYDENHGKKPFWQMNPIQEKLIQESDFANKIYEFADAMEIVGDLDVLSTYGLVKRNGKDTIVIIDFGLTGDVYSTYYDRRVA